MQILFFRFSVLIFLPLKVNQNVSWTAGVQQEIIHGSFSLELHKSGHELKKMVVICNQMVQSGVEYTLKRWLLTFVGLVLHVGDIVTDTVLVVTYLQEMNFVWMGLTLAVMLIGLLVTQIFSFVWNRDDMNTAHTVDTVILDKGLSKIKQIVLHLCGMGIFFR